VDANYSMLPTIVISSIFVFGKQGKYFYTILFMNKEPILLMFANSVQTHRKAQHLSQEELAELAGVHRTYIGMIERAEKNITLCNIEKIANALKVSIPVLLSGDTHDFKKD